MNGTSRTIAPLLVLSLSAGAWAHHGTAGYYDQKTLVRVEGVVKEFRWRNPHAGLYLAAKDTSGKDVVYALEMGSPLVLSGLGFSRKTFMPGDKVVADMHPSRGSPTAGELYSGRVWVNGKIISNKPGAPATEDYTR